MDKFNALLNTFDETEQKKENERLEKEAVEKETKALEIAFEDERSCGLVDLTEEFFYGLADFLGIREKVGSDLILEQKGDLSQSKYRDLFLTSVSEKTKFNQFQIKLEIKGNIFCYKLAIEQSITDENIYYGLYLKNITKEKCALFSEVHRGIFGGAFSSLFMAASSLTSQKISNMTEDSDKLQAGFALISIAQKADLYQRSNKDWQPIFEKILADFQEMIKKS